MFGDRFSHLQSELEAYYEQLAGKEKAKRLASQEEKVRLQQQIRELQAEIAPIEREYLTRWRSESVGLEIPEGDAEWFAAELATEVEILAAEPAVQQHQELMRSLEEIKAALQQSGSAASGKLKAAIPLLPGVLSYEVELDTEGLVRRTVPKVTQLMGRVAAKTPKK